MVRLDDASDRQIRDDGLDTLIFQIDLFSARGTLPCDLNDVMGRHKDYEFSATSMREHWQSCYEDTKRTLRREDWVVMPQHGSGIVVHDVHRNHDR